MHRKEQLLTKKKTYKGTGLVGLSSKIYTLWFYFEQKLQQHKLWSVM